MHDVTLLRFTHVGRISQTESVEATSGRYVRFIYRLNLSSLFPRLHDAVRGLATVDAESGHIQIVDVPRNYEIALRASLRSAEGTETLSSVLLLNKNGLLRVDDVTAELVAADGHRTPRPLVRGAFGESAPTFRASLCRTGLCVRRA